MATSDDFQQLRNAVEEQTKAVRDLTALLQRGAGGAGPGGGGPGGPGGLGSTPAVGAGAAGGASGMGGGQSFSPTSGFGLASIGHALHAAGQGSPTLNAVGTLATGAAAGPAGFGIAALGLVGSAMHEYSSGRTARTEATSAAGFEALSGAAGLTSGQAAAREARAREHEEYEQRVKLINEGTTFGGRHDPKTGRYFGGAGYAEGQKFARELGEEERGKQTAYDRQLSAEQGARAYVEQHYARAMAYGKDFEHNAGARMAYERQLNMRENLQRSQAGLDHIVSEVGKAHHDRLNVNAQGNAAKKANSQ